MKVNWKVRFKNKTWLMMFLSLIIGFVFNMLKLFDVATVVTENQIMNIVSQVLTFLGLFGVIIDPTTVGIDDSLRALSYEEPWNDELSQEEIDGTILGDTPGDGTVVAEEHNQK